MVVGGDVEQGGQEWGGGGVDVEEREKVEGLPNEGNSAFLNVLEWIISVARGSTWAMDRVRRVATQGAINSVGLVGGKLALSPEKQANVVFPIW